MPASPSSSPVTRPSHWLWIVPAAVALAYAGGHLGWYHETPLGRVPVVDELENLAFAEAIVRGELPHEPFYRAGGYPLLLALIRVAGVPTHGLFSAALALGAFLHAINAALIARIAAAWFGPGTATAPGRIPPAAALFAGLLYALNPVLVHYSTQALDAVPALTFFLAGLAGIAPVFAPLANEPAPAWRWAGVSMAWAAATLCRPNYLLVWGVLGVLASVVVIRIRAWQPLAAALGGVALFAAFAGWQWRVSGVAGFLPWQGTYNLWAANEPGAHGRYFVQRAVIPTALTHENTTRLESIYFFRQQNGRAPADYRDLNAYWQRRFIERITHDPAGWIGQLGRKAYALFNDWEQYNNKTYAFHKTRSPWLRWNPLSWGLLFVLGIGGFARLAQERPRAALSLGFIAAGGALSILLFFVSARFRLPLAAILTVLAGGALAQPLFWRTWPRRRQIVLATSVALGTLLTFSRFDGVRDRTPFAVDYALVARSAFTLGDYETAWQEATHALDLQAEHRDALRVAVGAYFNLLATGGGRVADEARWLQVCKRLLATNEADLRELRAVAALALWRAGQRTDAYAEWQNLGGTASAVAARLVVGDRSITPDDLARAPAPLWAEPLVRLVAAQFAIAPPPGVVLADREAAGAIVRRLFASAGQ